MASPGPETVRGARIAVPPLSERASRHRTIEQRLFVRLPSLWRRLAAAGSRLPPRSRLRQVMLARAMAQAYAAANRGDYDSVLVNWEPTGEYRPSADMMPPDVEPVFYGHDGYRQVWRYWLEAFGDIRWEPEEMLDLGDKVLVTTQQRGRGSGSGIALSKPVFQLFELRQGLVVRQSDFLDRTQALEAAGVRERPR